MEIDTKEELQLILAKRIKKLRIKEGVTQENAYGDTGIHFGRIEQGKRDPSYTTLIKISRYFNLKIEDFFSDGFDGV